eukprot:TRINITY_DN7157_c0_g1_i7.p2 TRINITY_DN7157_c0_g1~~TRINITY_DN7157_c0_g1_i7.p2  ORF type:complete len:259 (+),score=11.11 TRINITY_DN7157_c0_g1_i7:1797-2573(+)
MSSRAATCECRLQIKGCCDSEWRHSACRRDTDLFATDGVTRDPLVTDIPWPAVLPRDLEWHTPGEIESAVMDRMSGILRPPILDSRYELVVDCQPLQRMVSMEAEIADDQRLPTVSRILNNLHRIWQSNLRTRQNFSSPCRWVERRYNTAADFLCSCARNNNRRFTLGDTRNTAQLLKRGYCIQAHSDGSWEPTTNRGAAAFTVNGWCFDGAEWHQYFSMYDAMPLDYVASSFDAEMIALDMAVTHIRQATEAGQSDI